MCQKYIFKHMLVFILLCLCPLFSYENLTPAQVYQKLVSGDSLQLLDVREISEYNDGHIAEPAGRPVITPANLPWSSGVLQEHYSDLPKDVDLIVNCRSGGRSASASAFLESKGFTRVFNMTSGFSGWSYESRIGGYGDGSGAWVASDTVTIPCSQDPQSAFIHFSTGANPSSAFYVELHKVNPVYTAFENVPDSCLLFSVVVLNEFGLPLYTNDTLTLSNSADYSFMIHSTHAQSQVYSPLQGWMDIDSFISGSKLVISSNTIFKWLKVTPLETIVHQQQSASSFQLVKAYPNPFNGMLKIESPNDANISIYDTRGRLVTILRGNIWQPHNNLGSGVYFIQVRRYDKIWRQKVFYSK